MNLRDLITLKIYGAPFFVATIGKNYTYIFTSTDNYITVSSDNYIITGVN